MKSSVYPFRTTLAIAAFAFALGSCKHSDPSPSSSNSSSSQLDPTTSKSTLSTINVSVASEIKDANNQPGNIAIRTLSNISSTTGGELAPTAPINLRRSNPSNVNFGLLGFVEKLGKIGLNVTSQNNNLRIAPDFNASKGIWQYNDTIGDFVKTGTASDIVIEFPDSINFVNKTGINNCVYTIQQLQTQIVSNTNTIVGGTLIDTLITQMTANLYISGVKAMDLSFTATYGSDNQPNKVNYTLDIGDYTYTISLLEALPTETISESLEKSGTVVYSINYNANFQGDTVISSTFQVGDIKVSGTLDYDKFYAYIISSYSTGTVSQTATDSVFAYPYYTGTVSQVSTGAKIGDIKELRTKVSVGTAPNTYSYYTTTSVVVYKDGTYDSLSTVLSSVWSFLSSLIGGV